MALVIHTPYQDFQGLNRFSNGKFSQKWYYIFKIKKYKFLFSHSVEGQRCSYWDRFTGLNSRQLATTGCQANGLPKTHAC